MIFGIRIGLLYVCTYNNSINYTNITNKININNNINFNTNLHVTSLISI